MIWTPYSLNTSSTWWCRAVYSRIIPGTFVFATFGAGLGSVFDQGGEVSVKAILTPEIIAGLVGLAVLALVPVVVKKLRGRKA